MAKKDNIVTIDFNEYCTQAEYARISGTNLSTVSRWVMRAKDGKGRGIDILEITQLGITLVKRPLKG